MTNIIHIATVSVVLLQVVYPLRVALNQRSRFSEYSKDREEMSLRRLLQSIVTSRLNKVSLDRRAYADPIKIAKARGLYDDLSKSIRSGDFHKILREANEAAAPVMEVNNEFAGIVETELTDSLTKKKTLLEKAYVEQAGKNDFLVMQPDVDDPFVTVIPNNIYYNIEKKCVNWMDDCTLQGIRSRLLTKIRSPFK